jgi:hypothetical protein
MLTSDRRSEERPQSPSRRSVRRPALWLNLIVLCAGLAALVGAHMHRRRLDTRFARIVRTQVSSPYQLRTSEAIRFDGTDARVARSGVGRSSGDGTELRCRGVLLAIDTSSRKLRLHFDSEIVRETDVVIGEPRVVTAEGKSWRFVPLKRGLTVIGTLVDQPWDVPPWAYAMRNVLFRTCCRQSPAVSGST